jgi:putative ABC transport system permease protein
MIRNYFKIAWRNLVREKSFASINVIGLAVGMASSLLILEYVSFERSYDSFHEGASDIYRVQYDQAKQDGTVVAKATAPASVGQAMAITFPEISSVARFHLTNALLSYETKERKSVFREDNILMTDPSFLTFFSFPLLKGNAESALIDPKSIVITQALSQKYFGQEDPIGKTLKMTGGYGTWIGNGYEDVSYFTVTGVLASIPVNSHLKISALVSFKFLSRGEAELSNWGDSFYTYLRIKPSTSVELLESKLPEFVAKNLGEISKNALQLQPLRSLHLDSNLVGEIDTTGSRRMVSVLLVIALFISLIAWINYLNLTTARATDRAKEIGVRKITGASRRDLFRQFLIEAFLLNGLSLIFAIALVQLVQPIFNELTSQELSLLMLNDQTWLLACFGLFFGAVFLTSLYPIIANSSSQPAAVLRSRRLHSGEGIGLRKGLVVFQFVLSVIMIVGSLVVYQQLLFMQEYDTGLNLNRQLILDGPVNTDSTYVTKLGQFKAAALRLPSVQQVTVTNLIPGNPIKGYSEAGYVKRIDQPAEEVVGRYYFSQVDYDFQQAFDAQLIAGRWFSKEFEMDATPQNSVVVNETAARLLGFSNSTDAVGQPINYRVQSTPTIIGVMKDYHHLSLRNTIDPIIFELKAAPDGYYAINLKQANVPETVEVVRGLWESTFPESPFSAFLLENYFNRQYQSDQSFARITSIFTLLAIGVASLGLFGLVLLTTTQRQSEIGIRKVMGASVVSIVILLSKDLIKLVLIAIVIAAPIAWYAMNQWLTDFAYKIDISWGVFALAGGLAVGIALITMSLQSIKAALMNPVKSLRSE